jgi:Fur family ferric uptake transcriptional regulator
VPAITWSEPGSDPSESELRQLLRQSGLRVTVPRLAVLHVLSQDSHLEAEQVAARVRFQFGSVSAQTVYDVLQALTGAGLLRRIEPAGSARLYERRVGDNHHHAVCRRCGAVVDVDCATAAPCLEPPWPHRPAAGSSSTARPESDSDPDRPSPPATANPAPASPDPTPATTPASGYLVDEVEVVYWGLCPACQLL